MYISNGQDVGSFLTLACIKLRIRCLIRGYLIVVKTCLQLNSIQSNPLI